MLVSFSYSSPEHQFIRVEAIRNEEKITPQQHDRKAADDFSFGKSSGGCTTKRRHDKKQERTTRYTPDNCCIVYVNCLSRHIHSSVGI